MIDRILYHIKNKTLSATIRYKYAMFKWKLITKGKKFVIYKFRNQIKLKLYADSAFSKIIYHGNFEKEELAFFTSFIKPGYTVLDIGANIGLHSLYAASLVGNRGKVHAFEPVNATFQRLIENIYLNALENVQAHKLALSNSTSESQITVSKDGFDAWNSMAGKSGNTGSSFDVETIQTITLDDFMKNLKDITRIDFIKIDTEGWELQVLQGGKDYLLNHDPVIMVEYAEDICQNFGIDVKEVYDFLSEMGYYLFQYNLVSNSLRLVGREEHFGVANLIASKNSEFAI